MSTYTESSTDLHPQKESCKEEPTLDWYKCIELAESQIRQCRQRIAKLQRSIKIARKMIQDGVPF